MKIQGRLGVLATAVSGLLLAGLLFSAPAFAWHGTITNLNATCPAGSDKNVVSFWVSLSDKGRTGFVEAHVSVGGEQVGQETKTFGADDEAVRFEFEVPGPENDDTVVTVHVKTVFINGDKKEVSESEKSTKLEKCKKEETTTTTETTETTATTAPPSSTEAPSSSLGETSTTEAGGALPFTGSNSLPMLIAALVMVIGGLAAVYAGRIRGRHAK
jgi:hypothetical protein